MSTRHTAVPIQMYPPQGSFITVENAIVWANPNWTEVWAATSNAVHLVGFSTPSNYYRATEIEFAVGAAGEEEVIHTYRYEAMSGTNLAHAHIMFPVPLGNIPAGSRVSMRVRKATGATVQPYSLMYVENFDSGHKNAAPCKCWPYRDDSIEVEWNNTTWGNSDWYRINPVEDIDTEITLLDFSFTPSLYAACAAELDLSNGLTGEEDFHVLTTKRFLHSNASGFCHRVVFPGGFPFAAGTQLSFRVRRGGSFGAGLTSNFSWNYVYGTSFIS